MTITPTYPGVYVQEISSGVHTIVGVSTSRGLFIGRTKKGPLNKPKLCLGFTDFERNFSSDTSVGDMARYVKLFFQNGGMDCYIMRIASGATYASVTLLAEDGVTKALKLTAKNAGLEGETIRAAVTYCGAQPEATFNLELFNWETDSSGTKTKTNTETWKSLSMNPKSTLYAPTVISQNSKLVDATDPKAATVINGFSQSGRPVKIGAAADAAAFKAAWSPLFGSTAATTSCFQISVDGSGYVPVDLSGIDFSTLSAASLAACSGELADLIEAEIKAELVKKGYTGRTVTVSFLAGPTPAAGTTSLLRITSDNKGDVFVTTATSNDLAVPLMLGTAQGGLEAGAYIAGRPAPTAFVTRIGSDMTNPAAKDRDLYNYLGGRAQNSVNKMTLPAIKTDGSATTVDITLDLVTGAVAGTDLWYQDKISGSKNGNNDGLREKLGLIRDAVNAYGSSNARTFYWKAELWGSRLALIRTNGEDNFIDSDGDCATGVTIDLFTAAGGKPAIPIQKNVHYYSVGVDGTAGLQTSAGAMASDGTAPALSDYDDAYKIIDQQVDIFNLLVLPPDASPAETLADIYGPASVFCQERRAFLVMDPPTSWTDAESAMNGVSAMRVGLVKDHSGIFFPRITIKEKAGKVNIGSAGAIAGLMGRIDSARGVWKAPAGEEASLFGIVGLEYEFSDKENGVLNPRAINTLRRFPDGIVNWGARTMDGDDDFSSEYKYIPIRRLALFMEESLRRGLKWVVFEPNDEPLWAQIRLNVGVFMHNLFRKGAFQGQKPSDAYFVKCDAETTPQSDRNLGIVNIIVGFAPLKPAEFVILTLQQMAGQLET